MVRSQRATDGNLPSIKQRLAREIRARGEPRRWSYHGGLSGFATTHPGRAIGYAPEMGAAALVQRAAAFHAAIVINQKTGTLHADVPVSFQVAFQSLLADPGEATLQAYGHAIANVLTQAAPILEIAKSVPEVAHCYQTDVAYHDIPAAPFAAAARTAIGEDLLAELTRLTPRLPMMEDPFRSLAIDLTFRPQDVADDRGLGYATYQLIRPFLTSALIRPESLLSITALMPARMAVAAAGVASGLGFMYFLGFPEGISQRPRFFRGTTIYVNGAEAAYVNHVVFLGSKMTTVSFVKSPVGAVLSTLWKQDASRAWQNIPLLPHFLSKPNPSPPALVAAHA